MTGHACQPLHWVLQRAGTRHCETPSLEKVRWWHLLYCEEGHGGETPGHLSVWPSINVHLRDREGWNPPIPGHPTLEKGWRQPGHHFLQKAPTHQPVPRFPVPPFTSCQEGFDQVSVTEQEASPAHRTTCGRQNIAYLMSRRRTAILVLSSTLPPIHLANMWRTPRSHCWRRGATLPGDATLHSRSERGHQKGLQEIWHEGSLQVWTVTLLGLTKAKDPLPIEKQSKVVYWIPATMARPTHRWNQNKAGDHTKGHQDACQIGTLETSAVTEHTWENHHPLKWEETLVRDQARHPKELLLKEAIHIQITLLRLNLPRCWMAAAGLMSQEAGTNWGWLVTSSDTC